MNIINWAEKRAQNMNMKWYHYGALKIAVSSAMLLLAKFIPEILTLDWYWYAIIFVVSYVIVMARFFGAPKD